MREQALVRSICQQPFDGGRVWRAHGIGMLRTYLDEARLVRLNLWHSCLINPGISTMHTHPWTLRSHVQAGGLKNIRWDRVQPGHPMAQPWIEDRIPCGNISAPEFALKGEERLVHLAPRVPEVILPGSYYCQRPEEIHTTEFRDGTATIMYRDRAEGEFEASVFWPEGEVWGDATRDVTADEIVKVCHATLELLDLKC
jgi:hypothetical protein